MNRRVRLTWNPSKGASHYLVQRAQNDGGPYSTVQTTPATDYTDPSLLNETRYHYVVRAGSDAGASDASVEVAGTPYLEVCVSDRVAWTISAFRTSDGGNIAPIRRFGNFTEITSPSALALGPAGDLFVANRQQHSVVVHARLSSGNATAVRRIIGGDAGFFSTTGLAVDSTNQELYATNGFPSVTVHPVVAQGDAVPSRTIQGMQTLLSNPRGVAVDPQGRHFYVSNESFSGVSSITVYPIDAGGDIPPVARIVGPSTGLLRPTGIAVHPERRELFVANEFGNSVSVFPLLDGGNLAADGGDIAPLRTITGMNTMLMGPSQLSLRLDGGEVWVAQAGDGGIPGVVVFQETAAGNVAPVRFLGGSNTGLSLPTGIAVDSPNGECYVLNAGTNTITTYDLEDGGNVTYKRILSGGQSGVAQPYNLAVDPLSADLFVANYRGTTTLYPLLANGPTVVSTVSWGGSTSPLAKPAAVAVASGGAEFVVIDQGDGGMVHIFSRTNVSQSPLRTITGGNTRLIYPTGVAVDEVSNEIFVADLNRGAVLVFDKDAGGNVAPKRERALIAYGIAYDPANQEVWVATGFNSVMAFDRAALGDAGPVRTIEGDDAGFNTSLEIAVDPIGNEIFVLNVVGPPSIVVHPRDAGGNIRPLRVITGPSTQLVEPYGIAICSP